MPKGYYNIVHDGATSADKSRSTINFEINAGGQEIPEEQQLLVIDISNTLHTISLLHTKHSLEFQNYFDQLFSLAKVGLEGDNAQPALAAKALIQFKKEVVDRESGKRKNSYLKELGKRALSAATLLFAATWVTKEFLVDSQVCNCAFLVTELSNIGTLVAGTMAGVWLSFAITRTYLSFDDLAIIEKDRLEPTIRLVFTGLLALIFGLLFIRNAIEIKLGNLSSHSIVTDPVTAFLIGAILGLNEKIIGSTLTKKTADLFRSE